MKKTIKVKLKENAVLFAYLRESIIRDLLKVTDEDGMIAVRSTSNPLVFVELTTGWSIPEVCIDFFTYDVDTTENATGTVKVTTSVPECDVSESINDTTIYRGVPSRDLIKGLGLETLEVHSEPAEGTLWVAPSLTIPENSSSVVEPLEPFKMTKSMFHKTTSLTRRTHYVKLQLKDELLSFRFFFEAEDNKYLEGSWWLVQHGRDKQSIKVDARFIEKHFDDITGAYEIVGRLIPKRGYKKIKKNIHTGEVVETKE